MEAKSADFTVSNQQQLLILRLPEDLAGRLRYLIKEAGKPDSSLPSLIDVKPKDPTAPSNDFIFSLEGTEYPALLLNLPTPLEAHKTFDKKIFLKSGDIGQMLQVFKKEKERDVMRSKICKTSYGDYAPSGITAPTEDIVKRRFELTRINEDTFLPYKIRQITEEITTVNSTLSSAAQAAESKAVTTKGSKKAAKEQAKKEKEHLEQDSKHQSEPKKIEKITEEIVSFEEWMIDPNNPQRGRTLIIDGKDWGTLDAMLLLQHPELLITEEDKEEDEVEQLAAQQLRNKVAKQSQQRESTTPSLSLTSGGEGNSSSRSLNLQIDTSKGGAEVVGDDNEPVMIGAEVRMKLSLTIRRSSGEGQVEETGGEKYAIEDAPDMETDDAAMVADDEVVEDQEAVDESDDDDDLENLILQRSQQKAESSTDADREADMDDEGNRMDVEGGDQQKSKYDVDDEDDVGLNIDNGGNAQQGNQYGEDDSDEEDWMKGV